MNARACTVAIFDAHADTAEMLEHFLAVCGFHTINGPDGGGPDLATFIAAHNPDAVIYDVEPPYAANWDLLTLRTQVGPLRERAVVATSTSPGELRRLAGTAGATPEILAKPYTLPNLVSALARALATAGARWGRPVGAGRTISRPLELHRPESWINNCGEAN